MGRDLFRTQSRFSSAALGASAKAQQYIAEGHRWVVDLDLEKFFDRVNHDKLMAAVARRVRDKRMLKLIRAFLESGVMEGGLLSPVEENTPRKEGRCLLCCQTWCSMRWTGSWSGVSIALCATQMIAISTGRASGQGNGSCRA